MLGERPVVKLNFSRCVTDSLEISDSTASMGSDRPTMATRSEALIKAAISSINAPLDILICNAGYLGASGEAQLIDGLERHFVINHLGHFILVNRLLGRLYMADQGRVVVLGSRAAYTSAPESGIEFDNLDAHHDYEDRRAYGHSKLANVLFALQLGK